MNVDQFMIVERLTIETKHHGLHCAECPIWSWSESVVTRSVFQFVAAFSRDVFAKSRKNHADQIRLISF